MPSCGGPRGGVRAAARVAWPPVMGCAGGGLLRRWSPQALASSPIPFYHHPPSRNPYGLVVLENQGILLANSEAPKFRLTHHPSEGTEAWSNPCGHLGFVGGEMSSPTVSEGFLRQRPFLTNQHARAVSRNSIGVNPPMTAQGGRWRS